MRRQKEPLNTLKRIAQQEYRSINLDKLRPIRLKLEDLHSKRLPATAIEALRILTLPPEEGLYKLGLAFIVRVEDAESAAYVRGDKARRSNAKKLHADYNAILTRVSTALDNVNPPLSPMASFVMDATVASLRQKLECARVNAENDMSVKSRTSHLRDLITRHEKGELGEYRKESMFRILQETLVERANPYLFKAQSCVNAYNEILYDLCRYRAADPRVLSGLLIPELPPYGEKFYNALNDAVARTLKFESAIIELNSVRVAL